MSNDQIKQYAMLTEAIFSAANAVPEQQLLLEILNSVHEGIIIIDTDSRICYVNDSYVKMFHINREKIVGRLLKKFEPLARIHEVLKTGLPLTGDISYIHSAELDVCADIVPLKQNGRIIGALALMKNMSELVKSNRELAHYKALSQQLQEELSSKKALPPAFRDVIGHSRSFVSLLSLAARAASSNSSVCIMGESGVGKEVIAGAMHASSGRADGPLVKINCAAIPEPLLESELFGYEKGAFTGANTAGKPGKFELANGGTIFLDEIGEMPMHMQVKLLRVLQEREISRVGGTKAIQLDFRLITATNRDLAAMVREGTFREDLYYRINVIALMVPPLRERREDIIVFANRFLEELGQQYNREYRLSERAMDALQEYNWPGNVRELKNCMERAAVLAPGELIDLEQLPLRKDEKGTREPGNGQKASNYDLRSVKEEAEREAIRGALQAAGNNRSKAMKLLGISRRNFYLKLEKHGFPVKESELEENEE